MNKDEYLKYFSHELQLSKIFGYVLPIGIISLFVWTLTWVRDTQTVGILSQLLPFLYLPIFWFVYYAKPFGKAIPGSSEYFFDEIGWEKLAIRHGILKKLYSKAIRFFIYSIIFSAILLYITFLTQNQNTDIMIRFQHFLLFVVFVPGIMIFSMRMIVGFVNTYVDYYFYLSKAYFQLAINSEFLEEPMQSIWIINGLYAYKKYISKNIILNINNIETIYSKIISVSNQSMNQSLQIILDKLETPKKLDLLRYLLSLDDTNGKKLSLPPLGWKTKMKDTLPFVIPVVSLLVTVTIQLMKK